MLMFFPFRHYLSTDMKDPDLKFWTSKPNVFLIAVHEETKKVVGCISYREIDSDTGKKNNAQNCRSFSEKLIF